MRFEGVKQHELLLVRKETRGPDGALLEFKDIYYQDFERELNKLVRLSKSVRHIIAAKKENGSIFSQQKNGYELVRVDRKQRKDDLRKVLVDTVKMTKKLRE
jgi:hypothetical protein